MSSRTPVWFDQVTAEHLTPALSSPYGTARVISTRKAAGRITGDGGEPLEKMLSAGGPEYELHVADRPEDARQLARAAAGKGRYLVAAGGDRLIHEVVNGMLGTDPQPDSDFVLGVIPGPQGSEFTRTFGMPTGPADAISHLAGEPYFAVDAGRVSFRSRQGPKTELFVNIAEAGAGGRIVRIAALLPEAMGRAAALLGFWGTMATFRPPLSKARMDVRLYEGRLCNLVVANGQFFREGMRIAPKAHPSDGKFDTLIMKGGKRGYVEALTKARKGDHLPSRSIKEYMAARVEVSSDPPLCLQADGKFLGWTPATFELVPNAFRLKI